MAISNIRSVKIHNTYLLHPATDVDGGEWDADFTATTTGDTTITYAVSILVFDAPGPDPLNNEAFRVVVAHRMAETPVCLLSSLTYDVGSVVGAVLAHMMDASTMDMTSLPSLPRFI